VFKDTADFQKYLRTLTVYKNRTSLRRPICLMLSYLNISWL
jgi:hypothetical protein